MSQHSTQTEPNRMLQEEEERVRQAVLEALDEMYNAATQHASSVKKLKQALLPVKEKGRG